VLQALASLDQGTGTTSTDVHTLSLALIKHHLLLNIGFPLPIGSFFGVAHIVTKLRPLTTNLTFRHRSTFLSMIAADAMIPQMVDSRNHTGELSTTPS
jgi:hypothetical protein